MPVERFRGPNRNSLADGFAAFANSRGGMFVLGVEDKIYEVGGIPTDCLDSVMDFIRQECIGSIGPSIEDELAVVKAEVSAAKDAHLLPSSILPAL